MLCDTYSGLVWREDSDSATAKEYGKLFRSTENHQPVVSRSSAPRPLSMNMSISPQPKAHIL
jgi:hypothetical protein